MSGQGKGALGPCPQGTLASFLQRPTLSLFTDPQTVGAIPGNVMLGPPHCGTLPPAGPSHCTLGPEAGCLVLTLKLIAIHHISPPGLWEAQRFSGESPNIWQ